MISRPIAVFQHSALVAPGYFASFLDAHALPWRLVRVDLGEPVPADASVFAGLCFMGGEMSVNDELPWIAPELALIRQAVTLDIPVIGHCLGGQLMSRALGGTVSRNPVREIGWSEVEALPGPAAQTWLGDLQHFPVFQWHGETFSLPAGAELLFSNTHCSNQAFALGPHLGMQCHVEMSETLIEQWADQWRAEFARADAGSHAIQPRELLLEQSASRLPLMRRATDQLYRTWLAGVQARELARRLPASE